MHPLLGGQAYRGVGPAIYVPYRGRWNMISAGQQEVMVTVKDWWLLRKPGATVRIFSYPPPRTARALPGVQP